MPDSAGARRTWIITNPGPLSAQLKPSADPILTGMQMSLEASGSRDSHGNIVDYQWDLGSGTFDHDTGSTPTVTTSFNSPGREQVRVKVTDNLGDSDIAGAIIGVLPGPPSGQVGLAIDDGDYATNSRGVQLDVVWPALAESALVSNDGSFGPGGDTRTVPVAAKIPWTLEPGGSQRPPRHVYLHFPDSANPGVTFEDQILLDTTRPEVEGASLSATPRGRLYKVRLRARETISGISQVRFSTRRGGGIVLRLRGRTRRGIVKLSRTFSVKLGAKPKWAQVLSTAGNWSHWHRIRSTRG